MTIVYAASSFASEEAAKTWIDALSLTSVKPAAIASWYDTSTNESGLITYYLDDGAENPTKTSRTIGGISCAAVQVSDLGYFQLLDANGNITYTGTTAIKDDIGLSDVQNLAPSALPVSSATQAALDEKQDAMDGYGLSQNNFTDDEKTKLAGLESSLAKGWYTSESDLLTAYPNGTSTLLDGSYAYVVVTTEEDGEEVSTTYRYSYSTTDAAWSNAGEINESTLTPEEIKSQYESNDDTNAFTDAEKTKLAALSTSTGSGTVTSVNDIEPDGDGNVAITLASLGLSSTLEDLSYDDYPLSTAQEDDVVQLLLKYGFTWFLHSKSWRSQLISIDWNNQIYMRVSSQGDHYWLKWVQKTDLDEDDPEDIDIVIAGNAFGYDGKAGYFNTGEYGQDMTLTNNTMTGFDGKNVDYFGHQEPGIPFMKGVIDDCELQKGNHCWISIWDKTRHASYKIEIVGMTNHRYQVKITQCMSPLMNGFTEDTDD